MKLSFFHSIPVSVQCQNPDLRGFVFDLALGVSRPVDPLSGMSLNLVILQRILRELRVLAESRVWPSLEALWDEALPRASALVMGEGATLTELRWLEKRGWSVQFHSNGTRVWERTQLIELDHRLWELRWSLDSAEAPIPALHSANELAGAATAPGVISLRWRDFGHGQEGIHQGRGKI